MSSNTNCGCLGSRAMAMSVGVASAILWLPLLLTVVNSYAQWYFIFGDATGGAGFLLILTASAMSILMFVGASKKNAGYMVPWLAIHFGVILIGAAFSISTFVSTVTGRHQYPYLVNFIIFLSLTGLLAFLWSCVYLHHEILTNAAVQENATCANEGKIYKCPKEAEAAEVLYRHI